MNPCKFFLPPLVAFSTGVTCLASAPPAPEQPIDPTSSEQLRAAYLECDRVSAQSRVDQDFMIRCQKVADTLRLRDFGGDFERQIRWWRTVRKAPASGPGGDTPRAGLD